VLFIHNLRLVPLEQQTTRFRKALAQKAFALDTVGSFAVNIDILDFASTPCAILQLISIFWILSTDTRVQFCS